MGIFGAMIHDLVSVRKKIGKRSFKDSMCVWQEKDLREMEFVIAQANDSDNQTLPPTHTYSAHRKDFQTEKLSLLLALRHKLSFKTTNIHTQ